MPYIDKEKRLEAQRRYRKTAKGKQSVKRGLAKYFSSEKGKIAKRKGQSKYRKTAKGKANNQRYYQTDKGKIANTNHRLKNKYGITISDKEKMYDAQGGCCKLCLKPMKPGKDAHVEHCHKTGLIRGLVHRECNLLIGHAENNLDALYNVFEYLNISKER